MTLFKHSVATLLNVSNLDAWLNKPNTKELRKLAFDTIIPMAASFLEKKSNGITHSRSTSTTISSSSSCDSLVHLHNDSYENDSSINEVVLSIKLEKEKLEFIHQLETTNLKDKSLKSTSKFLLKYQLKYPSLFQLSLILYNIPASSAFIERFYSLSGNVCKSRSGNLSAETIIAKCMLKSNLEILKKLKKTQLNN